MRNSCILAGLLVVSLGQAALAQSVTYEGCVDIRGIPVASVPTYSINDTAIASLTLSGAPVIYYNPNSTKWMSRPTLLWGYAHECAHHALGHTFGSAHPLQKEQQADCFGIVEVVRRGLVDDAGVTAIQQWLSGGGSNWDHLPGPVRAVNLRMCLAAAGGSSHGPNSCKYAYDDECDEPDVCARGTDTADCSAPAGRPEAELVFRPWPSGSALFEVVVDGDYKGDLNNTVGTDRLDIGELVSGRHYYRLRDIGLLMGNKWLDLAGRCNGLFSVQDGKSTYTLTLIADFSTFTYHCKID